MRPTILSLTAALAIVAPSLAAAFPHHAAETPRSPALVAVAMTDAHDAVKVGDLTLTAGWLRAMLPGQPAGGGYVTITNGGSAPDRLIAVSTPAAGKSEIHMMEMKNDVMVMRPVEGGLEIPAGGTVELKPGGFHLMFIDLKEPIVEGTTVPVTVTFAKAGTVELNLPAMPIGSQGPAGAEAGSGHDQMEGMH